MVELRLEGPFTDLIAPLMFTLDLDQCYFLVRLGMTAHTTEQSLMTGLTLLVIVISQTTSLRTDPFRCSAPDPGLVTGVGPEAKVGW
jgi:hypothetical protein